MTDTIDRLAGVLPGSPLDAIRARRPEARRNAQHSHDLLFDPEDPRGVSTVERLAIAFFIAGLHRDDAASDHYRKALDSLAGGRFIAEAVAPAIADGATSGPYGSYPDGPLEAERTSGPVFALPAAQRRLLGGRLAAAMEHAHLLVFHPRDAGPEHLQRLAQAGWSPDDIVTLSQIVAFLSFQLRAVAGLRVFALTPRSS